MELRQLEVFLRVAALTSVTRAAEQLCLTQPALSRSLAALERELGAPLFDRFARSMELTPAGRALLPQAERLVQGAREAARAVAEVRSGVGGTLALGASSSAATYVLPGLLREYRQRFPNVELSIQTGGSARIADLVVASAVDLGIVMGITPRAELIEVPLAFFETVLVAAPSHSLAGTEGVTVEQVADEPLITMQPGTNLRGYVEELFNNRAPKVIMELDNVEAIKQMVEAGLGVSLLPRLAVKHEGEEGRLSLVRIKGLSIPERRMSVVHRRDRFMPAAGKELIRLLQESPLPE
jgi:DNA-binding transcriptional LysR family regulator